MENLETRFDVLFRLMPMMEQQISHNTGSLAAILQECLTLPASRPILASFGVQKLLAIRATTRISITGMQCHVGKTAEERIAEKAERDQLGKMLLDLYPVAIRLTEALSNMRNFQQQLFDGYINKQIPDAYIQGNFPPLFQQLQSLSTSERGREAMRGAGFLPLTADIATLASLLFLIAPVHVQHPAYMFSKALLTVTLSILSNLMIGCQESKLYVSSSNSLLAIVGDIISQKIKSSEQENNLLILISHFIRNTYYPGSGPLPLSLAHALRDARLSVRRGQAKEALSSALWTVTAAPTVASSLSSHIGFLESVIGSLQDGPPKDSEALTGILANCLPQRHVDPGILKPMVPSLCQLTKASDPAVRHCLRIFKTIVSTERGAEILLEHKTDVYLRMLHNHTNIQIKTEASELYRKIESKRNSEDVGFQWGKANTYLNQPYQQPIKQQPQQAMIFSEDHDRPVDFTVDQQPYEGYQSHEYPMINYTDLPKKQSMYPPKHESDKADSPFDYTKVGEDQPNVYKVEDTPNHPTSRSPKERRSPVPTEGKEDSKKMSGKSSTTQSGMASGYTSGLQSGARTPYGCHDTPLMFSRRSTPSVGSMESLDLPENVSDSEPGSRLVSGQVSPSDIPDSPGQQIEKINLERQQAAAAHTSQSQVSFGKPLYPPVQQQSLYTNASNPSFSSQQPKTFPPVTTAPPYNQQRPFFTPNIYSQPGSYQPFSFAVPQPLYGGGDMDDGPVAFNDEGSMSPRSKLSDLTIDSKSEISKASKEQPLKEDDEPPDGEKSFFDHHDNTVIDAKNGSDSDDDFINDLYKTGMNPSTKGGKSSNPKLKPSKPRNIIDPNLNVITYIEAKMAQSSESPAPPTPLSQSQSLPQFPPPPMYHIAPPNDDAPKPFHTEGTPANCSARTSFSNITIESGLSGMNKELTCLKIRKTPPVREEAPLFEKPDEVRLFDMVEDTPGHQSRTSSTTSVIDSNESSIIVDLDELAELGMPKRSDPKQEDPVSPIERPQFGLPQARGLKPEPAFSTGSLPLASPSQLKRPSKAVSENGVMITPTRIPRGRRSSRRSSGRSGSDTREGYSRTPKSVKQMFPPEPRRTPVHSTPQTPVDAHKSFSPKAKINMWKDKFLAKSEKKQKPEAHSDSAIL